MDQVLTDIYNYVQKGQSIKVRELTLKALNEGHDYNAIISTLLEAMDVIGTKFKRNDVFVPEVLIASRAFNIALEIIKPLIDDSDQIYKGKVVIGTVEGDLHDIGKNLVKMMLGGVGLEVIDLGNNISPQVFVEAIREYKPDIVAMSALLTTTMRNMKRTIQLIEKEGLRDQVKIIVGGAPVSSNYARAIGADIYSTDAMSAAESAIEIIELKK